MEFEDRDPLEHSIEYQRWLNWDPFDGSYECTSCSWLPTCMGGCPLKTIHPEMMPDEKVQLECTPLKFNWKKTLKMLVEKKTKGASGFPKIDDSSGHGSTCPS